MINISVIIPTYNRAVQLNAALDSISKQLYSSDLFEVIVIDNGSTDNTKEICDSYGIKFKNFQYFYESKPGLHVGRHTGLKNAKSDILVFADDDIEALPSWLDGILESFQRSQEVVLVGGKNIPKYEAIPPNWIMEKWNNKNGEKVIAYLSILDLGEVEKEIDPYLVFGCNFAIRKNILVEAGGFHPDGYPQKLIKFRGDGESYISQFIKERGLKTIYNPKASVYHLVPKKRATREYFDLRAFNQGISQSFAQIRRSKGKKSKIVKELVANLYHLFKLSFQKTDSTQVSYLKGMIFHETKFLTDNNVRAHVLRPNFID